jgi:hypothetical protein
MAQDFEPEIIIGKGGIGSVGTPHPLVYRQISIGGQEFTLAETDDFPREDPWSELTCGYIGQLAHSGIDSRDRSNLFAGRNILEAGIGDARNVLATGFHLPGNKAQLIGIELDDWRLEAGRHNLRAVGVADERVSLHQGDVVGWLKQTLDEPRLRGWGFACLPQAPEEATVNGADGYLKLDTLEGFIDLPLGQHTAETYGLTLNAAYLAGLRERAQLGDFRALVTLSGRVPAEVIKELLGITHWSLETSVSSTVQQDPDTGIEWVDAFDDGQRFREKLTDGTLGDYITAEVAENRRKQALEQHGDQARNFLNVFHELSVYRLRPAVRGPR